MQGCYKDLSLDIKQYLLRGGAWAVVGKLIIALMTLALYASLARLLSPEDMGGYILAFNMATFFAILARMGLEKTLLRFVSEALAYKKHGRVRTVIIKGLLLAAICSSAVALLVYIGIGNWLVQYIFKSDVLGDYFAYIAIWLVLLAFQFLFAEIFRAFHDIRMAVLVGGGATSVAVVIAVVFNLLAGEHIVLGQVLQWMLIASAMNILLSIFMLLKKLHSLEYAAEASGMTYSMLVGHSWPLLVNAITLFFLSQSDIWVLAVFLPDKEIAVYGIAAKLVLLTGMTLSIINAVVPPLIVRMNALGNKKKLEKLLRTTSTLAAVPSLVILFVFIFYSEWVLTFIYGEYYRMGAIVLSILSISQIVNVLVGMCGYTLVMTGYGRIVMIVSLVSAVIALGAGTILVQYNGMAGLAAGYAFAMIVQQVGMLLLAKHYCGVWTHVSLRHLSFSFDK